MCWQVLQASRGKPEREGSAVSTQGLYSSWSLLGASPKRPWTEQGGRAARVARGQLGKQRKNKPRRAGSDGGHAADLEPHTHKHTHIHTHSKARDKETSSGPRAPFSHPPTQVTNSN